jgi:hypothetical protein
MLATLELEEENRDKEYRNIGCYSAPRNIVETFVNSVHSSASSRHFDLIKEGLGALPHQKVRLFENEKCRWQWYIQRES